MDFISYLSNLVEGFFGQLVFGDASPDLRTQMLFPQVTDGVSTTATFQFLFTDVID